MRQTGRRHSGAGKSCCSAPRPAAVGASVTVFPAPMATPPAESPTWRLRLAVCRSALAFRGARRPAICDTIAAGSASSVTWTRSAIGASGSREFVQRCSRWASSAVLPAPGAPTISRVAPSKAWLRRASRSARPQACSISAISRSRPTKCKAGRRSRSSMKSRNPARSGPAGRCSSPSGARLGNRIFASPSGQYSGGPARPLAAYRRERSRSASTGTWSEGRSQPRASRSTSAPASAGPSAGAAQTWSRRRPRSEADQSRAR